ncbi:hypothetical protein RFI_12889 [Reticulomyxa filosa]|uniref:Uncharacterized protein n=1 Tax=Reticulomyxa filosa TaxID=46433 RepID=X6NES7_RETFI|nr:hypothetical protein RFI_12889 [Reticulomyxa filosa]|eukprot:ETO24269.1 hypothetical protein RFI_12889 [Reticulomyxa filosa]
MTSTMNETDVTELTKSIEELTNEMKTVQETYESSIQQLNQKFKQIEQCVNKNRNLTKTYYELLNEWEEVKLQVNQTSEKERIKYEGMVEEMKSQLEVIRSKSEVIGSYESKRSQFLILLMGNAPIKLWNESDRVKFKTEYNHFKERTLWFFVLFPVLQVYFHFSILLHQMHTLYLFYYYVSLAIRENILKQNGSRIEHWWIVHHYITLLVSLLFFVNITPNHPAVLTGGIYLVNYFMIWQGFIMALQMRYQGKRHYVRKVLAKKILWTFELLKSLTKDLTETLNS